MEPEIVQLSTRDLLLIAATLITAIAAFEAGYLRDLKDKIIELSFDTATRKRIGPDGWLNMTKKYRTLWWGFSLFSFSAAFTLLAFFGHSLFMVFSKPEDMCWSIFWSFIGLMMFLGWFFLMKTSIRRHDKRDPGDLRKRGIIA